MIPQKGDRVELLESGLRRYTRGSVWYADQLQCLVKWDDGRSSSLRIGIDRFRIIDEPLADTRPKSTEHDKPL